MKLNNKNSSAVREFEQWVDGEPQGTNEQQSHEQPASATVKSDDGNEWHTQETLNHGSRVVTASNKPIASYVRDHETARQIVTDHNQHQQCATQLRFLGNRAEELSSLLAGMTTERDGLHEQNERLREALLELKCRAEFVLTTPGFIRGRDELRRAIEAIRPDDVFDSALNHAEQGEGN